MWSKEAIDKLELVTEEIWKRIDLCLTHKTQVPNQDWQQLLSALRDVNELMKENHE